MTLGEHQRKFTRMIADLIIFAYEHGYELSFGEVKRSDEQAEINAMGPIGRRALVSYLMRTFPLLAEKIANNTGSGIRNSLHEMSLAVDFNLFKDGKYLSSTEDHKELGEYWESIGGTWGGRFNDGNHYSLSYGGIK